MMLCCLTRPVKPFTVPLQAIKILNMVKVYGKALRVNKASQDKDQLDVGANLFVGNLDPDVDEKARPIFPYICHELKP